ncbi:MAG: YkgJ family cysteine cluster protein [Alphaproteobacteria bacterium]|nr:YkgJ family cysteine cluster protein [Alphaproteobacteria bacterium]MCL2758472.1 YkgJ family cysteine cluster protein [Alphaproteobacteria bacterium]
MKIIDTNYELCKNCRRGGCCNKFDKINPPVVSKPELDKIQRIYGDDIPEFRRIGACEVSFKEVQEYFVPRIKTDMDRRLYEGLVDAMGGRFYHPAIKGKTCSMLAKNGCAIYKHRPLDCRLFPFTTQVRMVPGFSEMIWLVFDPTICGHAADSEWVREFIVRHTCDALDIAGGYRLDDLLEYTTVSYKLPHKERTDKLILCAPIPNGR